MIIFLCGFMGSGKSTLLSRFEGLSDWNVLDLDDVVFEKNATTEKDLAELIEKRGFDAFRRMEWEAISELLMAKKKTLVALGGGSLGGETLKLFKSARTERDDLHLVWLKTPFTLCWERIKDDQSRPLVREGEEGLKLLYQEREIYYQLADRAIAPSEQDEIKVPEELIISRR